MALQNAKRLILDGLSILGDPRPNPNQKAIVDGIHMRFGVGPDSELPRHGYHLFRRAVADAGERCVSQFLAGVPVGPVRGNVLETPYGTFTAAALAATDTFDPSGVAEINVTNDGFRFELPAGTTTRKFTARFGFRSDPSPASRVALDFGAVPRGDGPNPRLEQGVRFELFRPPGTRASATRVSDVSGIVGLECMGQLVITFPRPTWNLQISFRREMRDPAFTITSFSENLPPQGFPITMPIGGTSVGFGGSDGVTRVVIDAPGSLPLLTQLSFETRFEVSMTGFAGATRGPTVIANGKPGQIVTADLLGDAMTVVQITGGGAALIDLCYFTCLSQFMTKLPAGAVKGNVLETPYGTLTAAALTATDAFAPAGTAEIDLADEVRFALRPGTTARRVTAKIGFRKETKTPLVVDFRPQAAGDGPNPRSEQGVRFEVFRAPGALAPTTQIRASGGTMGLDCGKQTVITLPPQASNYHMTFTRRPQDPPVVIKLFTPNGQQAGEHVVTLGGTNNFGVQANVVLGKVTIDVPGEVLLHDVSVDIDAAPPEVVLTAFAGRRQVAAATVRGSRGEVVAAELTANAIASIRIGRGPAVLVDLCYTSTADIGAPWAFVPSFPYPLALPITHPGYPASSGAEGLSSRRIAAAQRVRYGTAPEAFPPSAPTPGVGTITLAAGSALAKGTGTSWTQAMVGQLIYPNTLDTAFAVMTVLAPDRLVLSRPHTGVAPLQNVTYRVVNADVDVFAQIHDQLGALLSEPAGMRKASMPPVIEQSTGVRRVVTSANPFKPGERLARGQGTNWTPDFEGLLVQVGSSPYVHRITTVEPSTQQLTLEPPYLGDIGTFAYRILSRSPNNNLEEGPAINLRPIDLLDLTALDPAFAQALGLYWIDSAAESDRRYDYMLLADHAGRFNRNGATALAWLNGKPDFSGTDVDGAQLSGIAHTGSGALAAPTTLQAYALPTGHMRARPDRPDVGDTDAALSIRDIATWSSRPPLMLDVWRAALGVNTPASGSPPTPQTYTALGETFLPFKRTTPPDAPRPFGWPDPAEVHYLDAGDDGLDVGWYAYRVAAIDLWGRYSALSAPIPWQSIDGVTQLHPYAVHVEDRTPPPPPSDVTVTVLEPDSVNDPLRVVDAAYTAWRAGVLPTTVGLRVSWRWKWSHELRAPDLQEFRVYAQSKPLNARFHRIASVAAAPGDPTRSVVKLAASDALATDAYKAATLQIKERGYAIEGSIGGTNLTLRVKNGGPTGAAVPPAGGEATIVVPYGHPLHRSVIEPKHWERWFGAVAQKAPTNATVRFDIDPMEDPDVVLYDDGANRLQGANAQWDLSKFRLDDLPANVPLTGIRPGIDVIAVAAEQTGAFALLGIASVAAAQKQIVPAAPVPSSLAAGTYRWAIGAVERELRGGGARWTAATKTLDLLPPKIARVRAGVDRIYLRIDAASTPASTQHYFDIESVDASQLVLAGNVALLTNGKLYDWRVGTPVRIYEAFFPAKLPGADDPGVGTQWLQPSLAEPVTYGTIGVSAADKRTEVPDWRTGRTRPGNEGVLASPATIFRVHREQPIQPADGAWDAEKLMASRAGYDGKSFFSVRWPTPDATKAPHYKALIFRASSETLFQVDKEQKRTYPLTFTAANDPRPSHWAPARKAKVATELFAAPFADYTKLSDDALSVLGNLPGNDEAFAQITIDPLLIGGGANPDRRGPDDPPAYVLRPTLNSWLDTIPGRTRARYLYKIAYVDSAQNRGPLSKASPPVDVPKVVPPRTPVITKIMGEDRAITIQWAANREPDLAGYRVYRTEDREKARDVRLMKKVGAAAAADVTYTDAVPGLIPFHYRVLAFDTSGNESPASPSVAGKAFDLHPPEPPVWVAAEWVKVDGTGAVLPWTSAVGAPAVRLAWSPDQAVMSALVQRRVEGAALWTSSTVVLGQSGPSFIDRNVQTSQTYSYKIKVANRGRLSSETEERQVVPPV